MFGNQSLYHATDDNISSKYQDAFNHAVKTATQRIIREITDYYKVGSSKEYPKWELNKDEIDELVRAYTPGVRIPSYEDDYLHRTGDDIT